MPLLGLTLCILVVAAMLRLEHRAERENSAALWIPTVWMMIAASRPVAQWFVKVVPGGETGGNDAGSPLDRTILLLLGAAAVAVLVRRRLNWRRHLRPHAWLLVLVAYMVLSAFWSEITVTSLKRVLRELIAPLMALVILCEAHPAQALVSLMRRTAYVLLPFSALLIRFFPQLGLQYSRWSGVQMWVGVTVQKNHLGRLCAFSILFLVFALYEYVRRRPPQAAARAQMGVDVLIVLLGFYLLIQSHSQTALVTLMLAVLMLVGLGVLARRLKQLPDVLLAAAVIALIAFGTATPFLGGNNVAGWTGSLDRDSTLTGRTDIWASLMPARAERPLLGYGFGSFWTDARRLAYDTPSAHNGYLDLMLDQGDVGLVLASAWLVACALRMNRCRSRQPRLGSLALAVLFLGLLYNTTESALNSFSDQTTALTVFASLILSPELVAVESRRRLGGWARQTLSKGLAPVPAWPVRPSPSPQPEGQSGGRSGGPGSRRHPEVLARQGKDFRP